MSRFINRGHPFNRNYNQGPQNTNFQGGNNYSNTYGNDGYAANDAYGYNSEGYPEATYYENQSYETSTDYTTGNIDYANNGNAEYSEGYSEGADYDETAGYDQTSGYDTGIGYDAGTGYDNTAGYNDGYDPSTTNYDGYEYEQQEPGGYTQSSNIDNSHNTTQWSGYSNFTNKPSFRGGPRGMGQFGNRMQTNNPLQNRQPNSSTQMSGQSGFPARGRGQLKSNSARRPFQKQRGAHSFGQFGETMKPEQNVNLNSSGKGQFNRVSGNTGNTNIQTKFHLENKTGVEKTVKLGQPQEKKSDEKVVLDAKEGKDNEKPMGELQENKLPNKEEADKVGELSKKEESQRNEKQQKKEELPGKVEQQKKEELSGKVEQQKKEELPKDEKETTEETKEGSNEDNESDSSDEDTDFCIYCKLNFSTPKAYHAHTRGLQHTTLVMQAKAEKGDARFQKEKVEPSVLEVNIPEPKKPAPVPDEPEYDYEENWMNLDEDVLKYMQDNKNPDNRDLNPNEIGRCPLPDDFVCPLCNVKCTGASAFKMHIEGRQHKSNIEAAKQGAKIKKKKQASSGVMVQTTDRPSKFADMVKDNPAPLLGLEYVTEFQKTDIKSPARYVCNMCESKCDGSTIIPHVIGLRHRLKYMQIKNPQMYEHMTKFNSKKKKSEMNANLEDFAIQIEKELGRSEVKIKVELENFDDEDELKETMIRHSKALAVKVKELEEGVTDTFDEELPSMSKLKEPPYKKAKMTENIPEGRSMRDNHERNREDPYDYNRRPAYDDARRQPYDDRRRPQYDDARRPAYDEARRPAYDETRRPPYDDPRRPSYMDSRRPPYDDSRDPYYRRRYPDDFRASYRDRFDPYGVDDPMYERRMLDERRRLDGLMGERHRLDDPYAERRRIDDILERRRYLDELEKSRVTDILERRKRLQETDVDFLRLQRFMGREATPASSSPSLSTEEKSRLDSQLARREALHANVAPANTVPANTVPANIRPANTVPAYTVPANVNPATQQPVIQAIQDKLSEHKSSNPNIAARQEQAAEALKQEAAKNPHVNIAEIMTNLSSSMIATEDDAAMALQVSNALTQALLKYRLQNVPKSMASLKEAFEPMLEQRPAEQSIPGLGGSSTTSSSVPSFLRSSTDSVRSPLQVASNSNTPVYQASVSATVPNTSSNLPYSQQQSYPTASQHQQYTSYTGTSQPVTSNTGLQSYPAASYASVSAVSNRATSSISSAPVGVPAPPHVLTAGQSQKKPVPNTANIDQPQKLLLESIRQQTELLKKKIQAATVSQASRSSVNVQSTDQHVTASTSTSFYPNPYTNYATSSASQATSLAGHVTSSANQSGSHSGHVTSSANPVPASQYSSQYYQYNYHSAPPNAAPQPVTQVQPPVPVPQVQPPLPTEPAPPLPTNDLPPLRRKHYR